MTHRTVSRPGTTAGAVSAFVPEGKTVKNRLRVLEQEGLDHYAEVMADPEENVFSIG